MLLFGCVTIYDPFLQKLGEHPVTVTCPTGGHQVIIVLHV